jgi:hypothetical protein
LPLTRANLLSVQILSVQNLTQALYVQVLSLQILNLQDLTHIRATIQSSATKTLLRAIKHIRAPLARRTRTPASPTTTRRGSFPSKTKILNSKITATVNGT